MNDTDWPLILTVDEAAALLHRSPGFVRSAARDGIIPGKRIGTNGHWRFSRDRLLAWAAEDS